MRDKELLRSLSELKSDFNALTGSSFSHFYCPVLHTDEQTKLCRGHVVNSAFPDSDRQWVVQRKDVDEFYGSRFESDFVQILYKESGSPISVLLDPTQSRLFNITITADGEPIEHFYAKGPMPVRFTGFKLETEEESVFLGLKIPPTEAQAKAAANWEVWASKDVTIEAFVSLLKAAYLTMFKLLGYQYALSADGAFIGRGMLGEFFLRYGRRPKREIRELAKRFFSPVQHMVRPVMKVPIGFRGTVSDGNLLLCRIPSADPWGALVFIRTSLQMHAVLMPLTETMTAREVYSSFLAGEATQLSASYARLESDRWIINPEPSTITWPKQGAAFGESQTEP